MSYLKINVDYDENLVTPRVHKQIMNTLFRMELENHKAAILPRHFLDVPETKPHGAYGYAPRKRKWQLRKQREGRGNLPDVYTGGMRTMVVQKSIVRATANGGTLTAKNHFPMTIQRRKEMEAISSREQERMGKRIQKNYVTLANHPDFKRKRKPKKRLTP